jgi:hypothetical protein
MRVFSTLTFIVLAFISHLKMDGQIVYSFTANTAAATGTVANISTISALTTNGTNPPVFVPTAAVSPVSAGYPSPSGGNSANVRAINNATFSTATNTYVQFVLTPAANNWVNITEIKWGNLSALTPVGPTSFLIYTSIDNYATPVWTSSTVALGNSWGTSLITANLTSNPIRGLTGTALTVRIYASGVSAAPAAGVINWRVDDLQIAATAQSGTLGQIPKYNGTNLFANSVINESPTGNIGIGVAGNTGVVGAANVPRLEIAGQIKITGGVPGANKVLTSDATGFASWQPAASGSSGWALTGNAATATDFLGTTNNQPLTFKVNSTYSGGIDPVNLNTSFGQEALNVNTGQQNTAIGNRSMYFNTTGSFNVAIGKNSLHNSISGVNNTAVGVATIGNNNSGSLNTGIGFSALNGNTTGNNNTAIGASALLTNTTGSNNSGIGYNANVSTNGLTNATAIGANALVGQSNSIVLGSISGVNGATSSVNVGIGTTTPTEKLHVLGTSIIEETNPTGSPYALTIKSTYGLNVDATNRGTANGSSPAVLITKNATATNVRYPHLFLNDTRNAGNKGLSFWMDGTGTGYINSYDFLGSTSAGTNLSLQSNGGNVGIGTNTPYDLLTINGTDGVSGVTIIRPGNAFMKALSAPNYNELKVGGGNQGLVSIYAHTTPVAFFNNDGSVGIGTTLPTPTAKLEVNGTVKIMGGTPGVGKVLTSDASGLASWAAAPTASSVNAWGLSGNAITAGQFLGTTNPQSLIFKANGLIAGRVDPDILNTNNVSFGAEALKSTTTGFANSAFGNYALAFNQTGNYNMAIGFQSMSNKLSGDENVGLGYNTIIYSNGSFNTALGSRALSAATGSGNIGVGYRSGKGIITATNPYGFMNGDNNIAIGSDTWLDGTASNQLNIGNFIYGSGLTGNGAGKLMIGFNDITKAGTNTLAVNGSALFTKATVKLYGNWPDYVFDENYKLKPLTEVEKFIQQNKHLPEVAPEKEVQKEGID